VNPRSWRKTTRLTSNYFGRASTSSPTSQPECRSTSTRRRTMKDPWSCCAPCSTTSWSNSGLLSSGPSSFSCSSSATVARTTWWMSMRRLYRWDLQAWLPISSSCRRRAVLSVSSTSESLTRLSTCFSKVSKMSSNDQLPPSTETHKCLSKNKKAIIWLS